MPGVKDTDKTRDRLNKKVTSLRQQVAELKQSKRELRKSKDSLRDSKEELEGIFNHVRDGIVLLDMTGKIVRINHRITDVTGYTEKDLIGKRFDLFKIFTAKTMLKMISSFTKTVAGQKVPPYEIEGYSKNGDRMIGELHKSLLRIRGKAVGVIVVIRDLTAYKHTEELLSKERESFSYVIQDSPHGVALIAKDGKYLNVNSAFTNITGYTLKDVHSGEDWFRKAFPDKQYREYVIKQWREDVATGMTRDKEFNVTKKDGAVKVIEFKGTPLRDGGFLIVLTDITDRKRAEEAYHAVVEHSLQGLHIIQGQREVFANSAYAEMLGYTIEELLALSPKQVKDLVYPDDQELVREYYRNITEDKLELPRYEFRVVKKDSSIRWVEAFPSRMEYRGQPAVQIAMVDITERKETEERLKTSEERYRTLVESSSDAILMLNRERNVVTCNQAFLDLFGYVRKEDVERQSIRIVHPSEESFHAYGKATYPMVERVGSLREEWDLKRKDGTVFSAEIVTSPVRSPDGKTTSYICIIRDITERKRAEQELEYFATHDVLTGLPNRTLFTDRLTMALVQARRSKKNLAVMMLDLDYFKDINDSRGHSIGDQALRAVGSRLRTVLRGGDTVARIGGDEFLLLLPEMVQAEYATTIAQKVLDAFREPFILNDNPLFITASIGIAIFPDAGNDADILIKNADTAMYRAKEEGRNNFQHCTPV